MNRDTALDLLSHPRRRTAVAVLRETGPVSRERLIDRVAARDRSSATRARVRAELDAEHLPLLADAGAVGYERESVTPTPRLAAVVAYLSDGDERSAPKERAREDGARPALREQLAGFYA